MNDSNFFKVRKSFLNFFKDRGHAIVPSSSLMPDDPSVLLTTAGMQQFKKYYTGQLDPIRDFNSARTVSLQKCFRTSDIDEVGDKTHLTFFEMMGNFSFGPVGSDNPEEVSSVGYFKKSAIVWAFEYLTGTLNIPSDNIFVTVFGGEENIPRDEESFKVWHKDIGLPKERIFYGNKKDNFWGPTGNEGPCGPTTEIYLASNPKEALKREGVEIWNIVFNAYLGKTGSNGLMEYKLVENPGIDTGMGFERLLTVLENKDSVFETSAFLPLMESVGQVVKANQRDTRILLDHIRSGIFLMADGIEPSNKEAGYVLRRILRRIITIQLKNDIHADVFSDGLAVIKNIFSDIYPEIKKEENKILNIWNEEKERFQEIINKGIKSIPKLKTISGEEAFNLYQSVGLPFDLIKEMAPSEAVKDLNYADFEKELEKHQDISRAGAEKKFGGHGLILDTGELKAGNEEELKKTIGFHTATHLLQWALRKVLGNGIKQMGSDINPERLRFDFSFERKMTAEEINQVENLINEQIKKDLPVYFKEMNKKEAENIGALSFFKEKYPDKVKVYFIGSDESGGVVSAEFCGGPHVDSTSQIGLFKIIKEESVGKGVRRIRAKTNEA